MGRCKEDSLVAGEEVAARRLAAAGRDASHVRAVDVHDELLIAAASVSRRLKDQAFAVVAEIRLGVLAAERELANVAEMRLVRLVTRVTRRAAAVKNKAKTAAPTRAAAVIDLDLVRGRRGCMPRI